MTASCDGHADLTQMQLPAWCFTGGSAHHFYTDGTASVKLPGGSANHIHRACHIVMISEPHICCDVGLQAERSDPGSKPEHGPQQSSIS